MQIIPAAACARALIETAAAFWVEAGEIRERWATIKQETVKAGISAEHSRQLTILCTKGMWGAKFDKKVSRLSDTYGGIARTNILTQLEKLPRVTEYALPEDYQLLCNTVHPSLGSVLTFSGPFEVHKTETYAFQPLSPLPIRTTTTINPDKIETVSVVEDALVRAAVFASRVILKTLDHGLHVIDDVALTTGAPDIANFTYWRNIRQKGRNSICPCRSGRLVKHCSHGWGAAVFPFLSEFESPFQKATY